MLKLELIRKRSIKAGIINIIKTPFIYAFKQKNIRLVFHP